MASEGRLEPIENGNFRVYDAADHVVGAIEKSEEGYQPIHAKSGAGPAMSTPEEAAAYLYEQAD